MGAKGITFLIDRTTVKLCRLPICHARAIIIQLANWRYRVQFCVCVCVCVCARDTWRTCPCPQVATVTCLGQLLHGRCPISSRYEIQFPPISRASSQIDVLYSSQLNTSILFYGSEIATRRCLKRGSSKGNRLVTLHHKHCDKNCRDKNRKTFLEVQHYVRYIHKCTIQVWSLDFAVSWTISAH